MREIKFRIWDEKYLTFEFNASPELFISTEGEVYEKDTVNFAMQTYDEYNKTDHYKISQYTGLKDKNGKEIYEGDIVKGKAYEFKDNPRIIGKVIYDYCEFKVLSHREKTSRLKAELNTIYEVIGNIFENPELLEGEQDGLLNRS